MNKKLHIGQHKGGKMLLPADAVTQTFGILAKRGVGKTYTALVMAEEMLAAGEQVVIFDPIDVTWGLRTSADGKSKGFPIIVFGGEHGDLPLKEEHARMVADFVVEDRISCALSTRHLSKAAQRRFITEFAERLYHRKGALKYRTPLHIFIDEADAFAPQRVNHGEARMLGAIDDLVRRGRASGIGVSVITQRAASINKDVLTQVECLVCLRTISPQDRKAIGAWIEAHDAHGQQKEFMDSLASLPIGTAWFWSPGWLDLFAKVKVRKRKTFDSSATPTGRKQSKAPRKVATINLPKLKDRLASVVEEAKANDPKELKKRIRELEKEVKAKPGASSSEDFHSAVLAECGKQLRASNKEMEQRVKPAVAAKGKMERALAVLTEATAELGDRLDKLGIPPRKLSDEELAGVKRHFQDRHKGTGASRGHVPPPVPGAPASRAAVNGMPRCPRAILTVLAQRDGKATTKTQAAILTGYSGKSGGFNNALSHLRSQGCMEGTGKDLRITPEGLAVLGDYDPLPSGDDLVRHWINSQPKCPSEILRVLADRYPESMTKEELGEATGYSSTSGGFNNGLSRLRTLELITRGTDISARAELFEA